MTILITLAWIGFGISIGIAITLIGAMIWHELHVRRERARGQP